LGLGNNGLGELGNGTTTSSNVPVQVSNLTGVTAIAAGQTHSMALKSDGTVWTWGDNTYGELGNSSNDQSITPVQVTGLTGVTAISAGGGFSLALKSDGTVWSWEIILLASWASELLPAAMSLPRSAACPK